MQTPETSIVIRTKNEEKHLGNLLQAIREQDYLDYEIVIVDSGSTDRTIEIAKQEAETLITIDSWNFTFGYALNVGCEAAKGKYIVIISAHCLPVGTGWLRSLIAPFGDERVAMVYGKHQSARVTKFSEHRDFLKFFPHNGAQRRYGNNANSAIRRSLWITYRFDERLPGLEDIHWVKVLAQKGFTAVYEPNASVYHIHEEPPKKVFERYRREAVAARSLNLSQPPLAGIHFRSLFRNIASDTLTSFPHFTLSRLVNILQFRYHQWRGSRHGWYEPKHVLFEGVEEKLPDNDAVVIEANQQTSLKPQTISSLKPGEVLIRVAYVGVCKTDLEVHSGELGYYKDGRAKYPIVPGHEFSGVIVALGANAQRFFSKDDRVVGECILSCKNCRYCNELLPAACEARKEVGVMNYHGAYARYVILPYLAVHRIPDGIDLRTACLTEPLAVVCRALTRIRWKEQGKRWAVLGAGPIGNLLTQVLLLEKKEVTVFDINAERLAVFNGEVSTSTSLDGLSRFDVLVEATGSSDVLTTLLQESRTGSRLLLLGFPYGNIEFNFEHVVAHEKTIVGSVGSTSADFQHALSVLPQLHLVPFLQTVLPLADYRRAWELHKTGKHLKILLQPNETT